MNCIKKLREIAGLRQVDLAAEMNMTQGAISHYELGTRIPSLEVSRQLLAVIKRHGVECTLDTMFPASEELAA